MEKITIERLTTDLVGVIAQINEIVAKKDIVSARTVLSQVAELIANENEVPLDKDVSDGKFDHVLHELLTKINGVIEIVEEKNNDPEIQKLTDELAEIDGLLSSDPDKLKEILEKRIAKADKDIAKYTERLAMLRSAEVKEPLSRKDRNALKRELEQVRKEIEENNTALSGKKGELDALIAGLDEEIKRSNEETKTTVVTEYLSEDQMGQADRALQEYAEKNGIDPSELTIVRKEIEDYDDGPRNEFAIARVEKVNEPILTTAERADIEEQLRQAREDLRKNGEKRNDPNVEYEMFRIEHTRLTGIINGLEARLKTDNERRAKNPKIAGYLTKIESTRAEIAKLEQKGKKLEERESELAGKLHEDDLAKKDKNSLRDKIKRAEKGLAKAQADKADAEKKLTEIPKDIDIASLEARKKAIQEELKKLREASKGGKVTDRLDLGAEAAKLGDAILKTADIRRELSERQITREDFLAFYEQGKKVAEARIAQIAEEHQKIENEVEAIFTEKDSGVDLDKQLSEAEQSKDDAKLIEVAKKLGANIFSIGDYNKELEALGIKNGEITNIEDARKLVSFVHDYKDKAGRAVIDLKKEGDEQKENLAIFDREIQIIRDEMEAVKTGKVDEIKAKSATEKELRAKQIRASMFGDPDLQAEWDETFARFHEHRKKVPFTYVDKDGKSHDLEYDSIEPYEGMEQDALFLNLEDYKFNLEQVSKFRASNGDISVLDPKITEGKSPEEIQAHMADMAEYVSTFHGLTNKHAVTYANLRTGGSTLKAMKPVKGDLPATQKMANAAENTLRFLGIRIPKFTKLDENGNKVLDLKGGLTTLAIDAAVIGGVVATGVLAGPIGLAGIGVGYAARGAVLLGNRAAAGIEHARFRDEIDQNLPTPFEAAKDAREVARKEYYREEQGMGKFTSWVKAKADRLPFFRKRAQETENAIVAARIALSDATIDERDAAAIATVEENAKKAEQNQQRRQENYRTTSRDARTYNDIVRDPDSVDKDAAAAAIARNAAIRSNGGHALEDVNAGSKAERTSKYVKPDEELAKTDELGEVVTEGGSISSTALTVEQIYTGEQQRIDRWNKVWTAILTTAGNIGLKAIRDGFMTEKTVTTKEPDQVVQVEKEVPITEEVTRTELDPNKTISDYTYDAIGRNDVYGGAESATSQIANPDAVAFSIKVDGKTVQMSLAESTSSYTTKHVHHLVDFDISKATPEQLFEYFRNNNGNFDKFVEGLGLSPNATNAEIAKAALEQHTMYGQSGSMEGWRKLAEDGLKTVTDTVVTGTKKVMESQIIPGKVTQQVIQEFDPSLIVEAAANGAILGAASGAVDQAHEANDQTKKTEPGTHEKLTPSMLISRIAEKKQAELNKKREAERNQNTDRDDQNNDDHEM